MSDFSREWDGVHLEGCAYFCECDGPMLCRGCYIYEVDKGRFCRCPELMIERAVGAAEMRADALKEE